MNTKFYMHTLPQPFHLSVGAVLFNEKREICVHRFTTSNIPAKLQFLAGGLATFHLLMRESLENNETLQEAVHRGLREEFGATGRIERYLGAVVCDVVTEKHTFQKTTLYHAVQLQSLGERPQVDEESQTDMEWHTARELLTLLQRQETLTGRQELHESVVVKRFIDAYESE